MVLKFFVYQLNNYDKKKIVQGKQEHRKIKYQGTIDEKNLGDVYFKIL